MTSSITTEDVRKISMSYLERRPVETNRRELIDAYKATVDKTPADTIQILLDKFGFNRTKQIICESINATSGDGRIYSEVADWARESDCASKEELEGYGMYGVTSWIHPSHLNQIGQEMMKKEKERKRQ